MPGTLGGGAGRGILVAADARPPTRTPGPPAAAASRSSSRSRSRPKAKEPPPPKEPPPRLDLGPDTGGPDGHQRRGPGGVLLPHARRPDRGRVRHPARHPARHPVRHPDPDRRPRRPSRGPGPDGQIARVLVTRPVPVGTSTTAIPTLVTTPALVPILSRGAFKIAENERPAPEDRFILSYSGYLERSRRPAGPARAGLHDPPRPGARHHDHPGRAGPAGGPARPGQPEPGDRRGPDPGPDRRPGPEHVRPPGGGRVREDPVRRGRVGRRAGPVLPAAGGRQPGRVRLRRPDVRVQVPGLDGRAGRPDGRAGRHRPDRAGHPDRGRGHPLDADPAVRRRAGRGRRLLRPGLQLGRHPDRQPGRDHPVQRPLGRVPDARRRQRPGPVGRPDGRGPRDHPVDPPERTA